MNKLKFENTSLFLLGEQQACALVCAKHHHCDLYTLQRTSFHLHSDYRNTNYHIGSILMNQVRIRKKFMISIPKKEQIHWKQHEIKFRPSSNWIMYKLYSIIFAKWHHFGSFVTISIDNIPIFSIQTLSKDSNNSQKMHSKAYDLFRWPSCASSMNKQFRFSAQISLQTKW